ncbi:endonuclease V [Sporobolomyces salmoneus]|uniref:endonuclease V n=1 Tax=Sporobolomyces salmoneus TaxID=183962 RepID=UPI003176ABF9
MTLPDPHAELVAQWIEDQKGLSSIAIFQAEALPFQVSCALSELVRTPKGSSTIVYRENPAALSFSGLDRVAGFDISFRDSIGEEGVAVLAVLSFPDLKVVKSISRQISLKSTPYVHSFLSFRESDHYVSLLRELEESDHEQPQVLFVDGNGRWHPRQAGSAVVVGVNTGLPTVGVAKDYHPIHSSDAFADDASLDTALPYPRDFMTSQKGMRKACQALLERRGDWMKLPGLSQKNESRVSAFDSWGAALLASPARNASNPIFVSPGHRLSLETSVKLALACSVNGKVPEPTRQADLIGRAEVKRIWG